MPGPHVFVVFVSNGERRCHGIGLRLVRWFLWYKNRMQRSNRIRHVHVQLGGMAGVRSDGRTDTESHVESHVGTDENAHVGTDEDTYYDTYDDAYDGSHDSHTYDGAHDSHAYYDTHIGSDVRSLSINDGARYGRAWRYTRGR